MIPEELKNYTYLKIMDMMMGEVNDDVYKNEGEIIYDTLSPAATGISTLIDKLRAFYINTFLATATGKYLDLKAKERGITRIGATNSVRRIYIYDKSGNRTDIEYGNYITPLGDGTLLYTVYEKEDVGIFKCVCNDSGKVGNLYIGECEYIGNDSSIGTIMMTDVVESARDEETDEELRARIFEGIKLKSFGGNLMSYKEWVKDNITIVGQVQTYARTAENQYIIVSVVDNDNLPMAQQQLDEIKEQLEPSDYPAGGKGIVPIGHHIQMSTATNKTIDVNIEIIVEAGKTVEELKNAIEEKIAGYIGEIKNNWGAFDENYDYTVIIYRSQMIAKVMEVEGVLSVSSLLINNEEEDCELEESRTIQEIPAVGEITIS